MTTTKTVQSVKTPTSLIICAGLPRTGIASLQLALERLLGSKVYRSRSVFSSTLSLLLWIKAGEDGLSDSEWRELFYGYEATLYPGAFFYRDLLKAYPSAKVILTTRDALCWVSSCQSTVFNKQLELNFVLSSLLWPSPLGRWDQQMSRLFGPTFDISNVEESVNRFNQWNQQVMDTVPADRLLVLDADTNMGWAPLCDFLELPAPTNVVYPKVNSCDSFRLQILKRNERFSVFGLVILIGLVAFMIRSIL